MDALLKTQELRGLLDESFLKLLEGQSTLQESLGIDEGEMQVRYGQAYALYQGKEYQAARDAFGQLVALNPWSYSYWMGLAAASQLQKDYEQALRAYAVAAMLEDKDPYPHYHAAQCLFFRGEYQEALKAVNLAETRLKTDFHIQETLATRVCRMKEQLLLKTCAYDPSSCPL